MKARADKHHWLWKTRPVEVDDSLMISGNAEFKHLIRSWACCVRCPRLAGNVSSLRRHTLCIGTKIRTATYRFTFDLLHTALWVVSQASSHGRCRTLILGSNLHSLGGTYFTMTYAICFADTAARILRAESFCTQLLLVFHVTNIRSHFISRAVRIQASDPRAW